MPKFFQTFSRRRKLGTVHFASKTRNSRRLAAENVRLQNGVEGRTRRTRGILSSTPFRSQNFEGCDCDLVGVAIARYHPLNPSFHTVDAPNLCQSRDDAVESDAVGTDLRFHCPVEPVLSPLCVSLLRTSVQDGVEADQIRSHVSTVHLQHPLLNPVNVAVLRTGVEHGAESDVVCLNAPPLHLEEPELCTLCVSRLCMSTDQCV
mmetsp:Transcript_19801/g.52998  ORF Transcript_19801/g.52998 Transcript_19801/m.52998 type:complete len:205 (+) Transcript_19801:503-1117(+)